MPLREQERDNFAFFLDLPEVDRTKVKIDVKGSQFFQPLFEYSGACEGCGETPYVKLLTQLFGDRLLIGNATGCSSIYGGNLPTTPYAVDGNGRGPAWSNSLFEDTAEFSPRLPPRHRPDREGGTPPAQRPRRQVGDKLVDELLLADQLSEEGIADQRARVEALRKKLEGIDGPEASQPRQPRRLPGQEERLGRRRRRLGLRHRLRRSRPHPGIGRNVNLPGARHRRLLQHRRPGLQGDTARRGRQVRHGRQGDPAKDLGMMAMAYGHVYVASVAFGAKDTQTVRAFLEAESYDGPSIIIAYSHCIAHGYNLADGLEHQKMAVDSGAWPLYRFDPRRTAMGENPLKLDSKAPKISFEEYALSETRFRMLAKTNPERSKRLLQEAQRVVQAKYDHVRTAGETALRL